MDRELVLFSLLRNQLCEETLDESVLSGVTEEDLDKLYTFSAAQDLAHLVGQSLSKYKQLPDCQALKDCKDAAMQAVFRYVRLNYTLEQICRCLEQAQIPFLPLKGSVLRAYYPEPWMRTSCDIDVLVREEDLDRAKDVLMQDCAFSYQGKSGHDVSLYSPEGVHLELHYDMLEEGWAANAHKVLSRVWEDACPVDGKRYHHQLSDAMFYFHHIAHMARHFENGGCGVRPFLDVWILNEKVPHDRQARLSLLRSGGLASFEDGALRLARVWLSGQTYDALTRQMADYILGAGIYGSRENLVKLQQAKRGGKLRFLLFRLFLPYPYMKARYPILEKHKWLLPFFEVVRWCETLFGGKAKQTLSEIRTNAESSDEQLLTAARMLTELGL